MIACVEFVEQHGAGNFFLEVAVVDLVEVLAGLSVRQEGIDFNSINESSLLKLETSVGIKPITINASVTRWATLTLVL